MPTFYSTDYCGVHVQKEANRYWIISDDGNDVFCGNSFPSKEAIEVYVSYYK